MEFDSGDEDGAIFRTTEQRTQHSKPGVSAPAVRTAPDCATMNPGIVLQAHH
jgi:hypothetical protein